MEHDRPVVLGGGVAGISAAVALAEQGARPILIESRPYLGGRARSFLHQPSGDVIDNGQHLFMGCYHATWRLLERLGTRHLVQLQPELRIAFRDANGRSDELRAAGFLPARLQVFAGMVRMRAFENADRASIWRHGQLIRRYGVGTDETVAQLLKRSRATAKARAYLWDPLCIAALNTPPQFASSSVFCAVVKRAFMGKAGDSSLGFASRGLSELFAPAKEYIEKRGGRVMLNETVELLEYDETRFRIAIAGGEPISTNCLISALPLNALRRIARGELAAALPGSDLQHSPIVSIYLWFDRPLPRIPSITAMVGTKTQWIFNRRRMAAPESGARCPGLLSCTISAAYEEAATSSQEVVATAERELRRAFPELFGAQLIDLLVIKEKHATFLATREAEKVRPDSATSISGFYLAGGWTNTALPDSIEGAVWSGEVAARSSRTI